VGTSHPSKPHLSTEHRKSTPLQIAGLNVIRGGAGQREAWLWVHGKNFLVEEQCLQDLHLELSEFPLVAETFHDPGLLRGSYKGISEIKAIKTSSTKL
jgi:hypothetical protein